MAQIPPIRDAGVNGPRKLARAPSRPHIGKSRHKRPVAEERETMAQGIARRAAILATGSALFAAAPVVRGADASLLPTVPQSTGPFYPPEMPLDHDSDLVRVAGAAAQAIGTVVHVLGRVQATNGRPLPGARIEIWQCDANGRYLHPGDSGARPRDGGFQGYGQTVTAVDGGYRFRTIKPVPYPGRTPHIHFAIAAAGFAPLVTQMYVAGEPLNEQDFLYRRIDPAVRPGVTVALEAGDDLEPGALKGRFDIVIDRRG
jgi:protocatechuate 3,4-dioxygenase beta subunit